MTLPRCFTLIALLSGSLILSLGGCEDITAKQRDEVDARLTELRTDLRKAMAAGGATAEEYQQKLTSVVTALGSVNGGEPGQQAAKALLAAEAEREIAAGHTGVAAGIERAHAGELGVISAQVDAAIRLNSLAGGLAAMDAAEQRTALQTQIQQAQQSAATLREHIATLEGPINERTTQNQQQGQEIERMRIEVGNLLQQARDQGYSAGLETYMRAMQLGREADKIELQVSQRTIDLDHELSPQHRMATSQLQQVEALTAALEAARTEIDAFATAASGDAQASRTKAGELTSQIQEGLGSIKPEADGALQSAYEEATAALDRAATNATKAASGGGDANAAKMMSASIHEAAARVHLAAARGLADRRGVLEKVKASGGAVQIAGVDGQLNEISAAWQQHIDKRREALAAASESLEGMSGTGSSEIEAFRANLQTLNNALAGKPAAPSESEAPAATSDEDADAAAPAPDSDAGAGAPGATPPEPEPEPAEPMALGAGAESPEALAAALTAVKSAVEMPAVFDYAVPPADAPSQAAIQAMRSMAEGMSALEAAVQAKFNKSLADVPGIGAGMIDEMPIFNGATADAAASTVSVTFADGGTATLPISQVNGRWYVGAEGDEGAGMRGLLRAEAAELASMPEEERTTLAGVGASMTALAKSVETGEFATFEDFASQVNQRLQHGASADEPNK